MDLKTFLLSKKYQNHVGVCFFHSHVWVQIDVQEPEVAAFKDFQQTPTPQQQLRNKYLQSDFTASRPVLAGKRLKEEFAVWRLTYFFFFQKCKWGHFKLNTSIDKYETECWPTADSFALQWYSMLKLHGLRSYTQRLLGNLNWWFTQKFKFNHYLLTLVFF